MTGKFQADIRYEMGRGNCTGSDDYIIHSGIKIGLDRVCVTDAASHLDVDPGECIADVMYDLRIDWCPGYCPVQVHNMQPFCTCFNPTLRHLDWIVAVNGFIIHTALPQTDAFPLFEINSRNQKHGIFLGMRRPEEFELDEGLLSCESGLSIFYSIFNLSIS